MREAIEEQDSKEKQNKYFLALMVILNEDMQ